MTDDSVAEGTRPWPVGIWLGPAAIWLLWHMQAGPGVWDAGELSAAALTLGGSHPPGQPLHALLGYALSLIPLGPMVLRVAALSVLTELGAAWLVVRLTRRVHARLGSRPLDLLGELAAHVAGISCLLAAPMWRQASRVEVYGLALLLFVACLDSLLAWIDGSRRALRQAALWAGLAAAVHPPHALAAIAVGGVFLLALRREALPSLRALPWATLAFLSGLACYAYLPLRASAGATLWGDPSSLEGFWRYVSGAVYRQNLGASEHAGVDNARYLFTVLGPAASVGVVLLLAWTLRRGREAGRATWALALMPVAATCAAFMQPLEVLNADNVAYFAPAVAAALPVAAACIALLPLARLREPILGLTLLSFLGAAPMAGDLAASGRADDVCLETLAGEFTDTPPPRALVVLRSDFAGSAFMLARAAEGARPDVALFVEGLATTRWHWRSLAPHPLFDGRPLRGHGASAQEAWVDGAVVRAAGRVSIVSQEDQCLRGRGAVAGPYLGVGTGEGGRKRWVTSVAERLEPELGREAAAAPPSDADVVAGVLREEALSRARRLLARGLPNPAGIAYRRALGFLPEELRASVDTLSAPRMAAPPVIREPGVMLPTEGDALREAASSVLVAGDPGDALRLLEGDERRGDARALLQFAVFEWARGALPEARAALHAFEDAAPELRSEGDALRQQLEPSPSEPGQEPNP